MALKWKGRVRETTTTTGTGALTLAGAVTSYGTFSSLMSTGDTCYGTVAHRTATEWEDCLFTMLSDGTLQRTTVIDGSSGPGVPVSLSSGTKDVFLGLPPAIVETLLGASLVTLGTSSYITSERVLTAGSGISLTDAGAGSTLTIAATGSYQPLDATLTALAAYNTAGLLTQTASDTFTGRTITGTSGTITVTNGDGVSGNPTVTISASYAGQTSITTLGTIATGTWAATALDHGSQLTGLTDDDHTQYVLLAGRSGGQTIIGGTAASNSLTLQSTSNGTKGNLVFGTSKYDEVNNWLGVGVTPTTTLHVQGPALFTPQSTATNLWLLNASVTAFDGATNLFNIQRDGTSRMAFSVYSGDAVVANGVKISAGTSNCVVIDGAGSGGKPGLEFQISGSGVMYVGNASANAWNVKIAGPAAARVPLVVQGTTSHSASVQEWWDVSSNVLGSISPAGLATFRLFDSATNSVSNAVVIAHRTSGSPAAGLGSAIVFQIESSTTDDQSAGLISCAWTDATHATRTSKLSFSAYYTSTAQEMLSLTAHASGVRFSITSIGGYITSPGGLTAGAFNEVYGQGAGAALASGATNNTLAGYGAGAAVSTSDDHTIIGYLTGPTLTTGGGCTIIGSGADVYNATDNGAVVIGHGARSGDGCVAVGRSAVAQGTNGVAVGKSASAGGSLGVAIGTLCLAANTDGIVIGDTQQTGASYQTLIGRQLSGDGAGSFCFGHKSQDTFLAWMRDTSGVGSGTAKAQIRVVPGWDVATEGSQMGKVSLQVMDVTTARTAIQAIATSGASKLGFFAATPVVKPATTGTVTGYTGGGGTALTHSDTFTGNTGATAYTIGDIVKALKDLGLLTA